MYNSKWISYGTAWNLEADANNENLTYDNNGNIKSLFRNQRKSQLSGTTLSFAAENIDNLTYYYANTWNGDHLTKIEDLSGRLEGYNNGASQPVEYAYDSLGSLKSDLNKGITAIAYNMLNKPKSITFASGKVIQYTYGADGQKLQMVVTQGASTTTDYVGGFVYQNNTLSFFSSPEGRVVVNGANMEYQYGISDHLGNTRVLFSSVTPPPLILTATFEGDANDNSNQFQNVSNVVSHAGANHTPAGIKVVRMNQTYKVGPTKNLKVYPGDKVDLEVYAYYDVNSGFGTTDFSAATMVTAIAGAFGGVSGGGGESGMIYNGVNNAIGAWGLGGNRTDAAPAAYLNYILFDQSYKVLNMGWVPVPSSAYLANQKISLPTVNVAEAGYIFVYLSYEDQSNNFVHFDDLKITHTKTNVIQYSDYYPFGMQTNSSWTRENSSNNYLYDAGAELNANSGWYETVFRVYDPVIGRMHQVDPLASAFPFSTPYGYASNNPVIFNDPNGAAPSPCAPPDFNDRFMKGGGEMDMGEFKDWLSSIRDIDTNAMLMSQSDFNAYYGINGAGDKERVGVAAASQQGGWAVFHDGNIYLYQDRSFWTDFSGSYQGGEINTLAAYKNGQGMEYQFGMSSDQHDQYDAHSLSISGVLAFGGGVDGSFGIVWNKAGDWRFYVSGGPSVGMDASIGISVKSVKLNKPGQFDPNQYGGWGSSHNLGIGVWDFVLIGGDNSPNMSTGTMGKTYTESGGGVSFIGLPFGYSYQMANTFFPGD